MALGKFGKLDRGKTVSKPATMRSLELALSEKQNPQNVEKTESVHELRGALETVTVVRRQVLYPPELRAHSMSYGRL